MNRRRLLFAALWLAAASAPVCSGRDRSVQSDQAEADSSFWSMSIQELQDYKKYTLRQIDALHREKKKLIRRGIETGERLLAEKSGSQYLDDILIRLADLTYLEEKDAYLDSMQAAEDREVATGVRQAEEPKPDFHKSMALYQRILDGFPKGELVDDALYNQGFLFEEMEDHASANRAFEQLIDRYPESRFAVEASMRLGEYYFNPPVNDLEKAIAHYSRVTGKPSNPRYPEAIYKLGWSHYRLGQLPRAISYFTMLIEAVDGKGPAEGGFASAATDLGEEAVDYIAVCFVDFGGPTAAAEYLRKLSNPAWGLNLLEKLGRVYMDDKEDYQNAILAYARMLEINPAFDEAPRIQMRIADCHRLLKDESGAFEARQRLFLTYKAGGIWWNAVTESKRRREAESLCEQALRENFQWLIRRAESTAQDRAFYQQAVELGRSYLETFPDDVHALLVRWNVALVLDTKLHQYKDALLEYFAISMAYADDSFQEFARAEGLPSTQDAAENAIVMADTLARQDRHVHPFAGDSAKAESRKAEAAETEVDQTNVPQAGITAAEVPKAGTSAEAGPAGGGEGLPLAESEKWLAIAYDNYIKLFPFDPKTQTMLINAGVLYYGHHNYVEALKYFKTLIKNFPGGQRMEEVNFSVIDSYFGNHDYASAEIYCRKLLQDSAAPEIRPRLNRRLGEAIFRNAQDLALGGRSREAGNEFIRMALEAPKVDFTDRALFNAGREYDKIRELDSAIRAYEMLRASCPGSKFLPDAINNLAFDYSEKGDYRRSAERYEELFRQLNEGPQAKDALYNALSFSAKAEDWIKSIELGNLYASRYPDASDAPRIYFQNAENYRKINDLRGMEGIYRRLPAVFPASPLGVESLFRLGKICIGRDSTAEAEHWFLQAVRKSDSLIAAGTASDPAAASEALFLASRIQQSRFNDMTFRLPEADMRSAMDAKQTLLQNLADQYAKVAAFRTARLPEALFRIGEAYEEFARAWAGQEIPPLDPIARAVREKTINERTRRVYGESLEAYLGGLRVLDKIQKDAGQSPVPGSAGPPQTGDSLLAESGIWSARMRPKISEVLFRTAEIQTHSIDNLLRAPVPAELSDMAKLEYRNQVLIKVIKPLVDGAAEAHRRNLTMADSLSMANAWVDSSRSQIQATLFLLARNYETLAWDALGRYRHWTDLYRKDREEPWNLPAEWTDMVINSLELSKSYSQAVILFGRDGIQKAARIGVGPDKRIPDQEFLARFALRMADTLEVLAASAEENQKQSEALYHNTGDGRMENMPALFEDNSAFIGKYRFSVLEEAFAADREFDPPSPSGGWLAARLIRMDPLNAPGKLNIRMDSLDVATDTTWTCADGNPPESAGETQDVPGWTAVKEDTSGRDSVPSDGDFLWIHNASPDTLQVRRMLQKEFIIPGIPVFGSIRMGVNRSARLFLNGKYAAEGSRMDIEDLAAFVRPGQNRLRLEFTEAGPFSAGGRVRLRYIPEKSSIEANL